MNTNDPQEWDILSEKTIKPLRARVPSNFTARVMEAVRQENAVPKSIWTRPFFQWAIPSLGLAAAAILLAMTFPIGSSAVGVEDLLLANDNGAVYAESQNDIVQMDALLDIDDLL